MLQLPGPDFVDRVWACSDRHPQVLVNLQRMYGTGRLANTGYMSILPVDQGIEHSAGASFAANRWIYSECTLCRYKEATL
jgi:class I fructose-bisphosphate aldolase